MHVTGIRQLRYDCITPNNDKLNSIEDLYFSLILICLYSDRPVLKQAYSSKLCVILNCQYYEYVLIKILLISYFVFLLVFLQTTRPVMFNKDFHQDHREQGLQTFQLVTVAELLHPIIAVSYNHQHENWRNNGCDLNATSLAHQSKVETQFSTHAAFAARFCNKQASRLYDILPCHLYCLRRVILHEQLFIRKLTSFSTR